MNERLRILKMLEQGTINAEEAARLLEALSHGESRKRPGVKIWNSLEGIPQIIATAIDSSARFNSTEEEIEFDPRAKVEFKGISGDLAIIGKPDIAKILVKKDGLTKITEQKDTLKIKALSGDIRITTPLKTAVSIKGISGDLKLAHLNSTTNIETVSGDILGNELSGMFYGDIVSGDIDLDFASVKGITLKSRSGNVVLWLDDKINATLAISNEKGKILCDFDLKNEEKSKKTLTGIINKPGAIIEISNKSGHIAIKKRSQRPKDA